MMILFIEWSENLTSILVAIIGLFGVILTALFGIHKWKKESYAKRITESRIEWLERVRGDYSIIMAAYETKYATSNNQQSPVEKDEYNQRMFEAEKARYDLISRLKESPSPSNKYNSVLKEILRKMDYIKTGNKLSDQEKEQFILYMNFMLEDVWDECKKETT